MPRLGRGSRLSATNHPAVLAILVYGTVTLVGTALLLLPLARATGATPSLITALFTATSALCVTGLTVVDTGTYWSTFGHVVILALVQIGGIGIMVMASLLGLTVSRRLGLRSRLRAQEEVGAVDLGEVRRLIRSVVLISLVVEALTAVVLSLRFAQRYGFSAGEAIWNGTFHAVSAFNNAGFALFPDSLMRFVTDWWVCVPILGAVVIGGLGFPVLVELIRDRLRWSRWSLHAKLTIVTSGALFVIGAVVVTALEWSNPGTLGVLNIPGHLLAGMFQGITPRSVGFSTVDYAHMHDTTLVVTDALMFLGAGSAGTSGGIKVTTFVVLLLAIVAEARGHDQVEAFGRAIPTSIVRQALSVALLAVAIVFLGTLLLMELGHVDLDHAFFETTSAFATTGLTTGITPALAAPAKLLLVAFMFIGRVGTVTVASALALRNSPRLFRLPEERPIVG